MPEHVEAGIHPKKPGGSMQLLPSSQDPIGINATSVSCHDGQSSGSGLISSLPSNGRGKSGMKAELYCEVFFATLPA